MKYQSCLGDNRNFCLKSKGLRQDLAKRDILDLQLCEQKFYYRLRQKKFTIYFLLMIFKFSLKLTAKDLI